MALSEGPKMDCGEPAHQEFLSRVEAIPLNGLGLSVDVHSPDLPSLRRSLLARQVPPAYFEIFRNTTRTLAVTRSEVGDARLTYHGEGLWMTQPGVTDSELFQRAVREAGEHLHALQSAWLNHECAAKVFAGYCYGTYLPPLFGNLDEAAKSIRDENTETGKTEESPGAAEPQSK